MLLSSTADSSSANNKSGIAGHLNGMTKRLILPLFKSYLKLRFSYKSLLIPSLHQPIKNKLWENEHFSTAVQMVLQRMVRSVTGPTLFLPTYSCLDNCTFRIADNCKRSPPSFSWPWKVLSTVYHYIVGSWWEMLNENFIFGIKGLRPHCDLNNTPTASHLRGYLSHRVPFPLLALSTSEVWVAFSPGSFPLSVRGRKEPGNLGGFKPLTSGGSARAPSIRLQS